MVIFYFAYGSNMDRERMAKRGVKIISETKAILEGWKLIFNKAATEYCSYANIEGDDSSKVYGVLYEIDDKDIEKLDRYEGCPDHYERKTMVVVNNKINKIKAEVYVATPKKIKPNLKPLKDYLRRLMEGAKQHGFPKGIIESLEKTGVCDR